VARITQADGRDDRRIALAYAERLRLKLTKAKVRLLLDLEVEIAKLGADGADNQRREWSSTPRFLKHLEKLKSVAHRLDMEHVRPKAVVAAYVTFENYLDADRLIDSWEGAKQLKNDSHKGQDWTIEQRGVRIQRRWRRLVSLAGACALLLVGFGIVVFADSMKGNLSYLADCTEAMSIDGIGGPYCDPFTLNETAPLMDNATDADAVCMASHRSHSRTVPPHHVRSHWLVILNGVVVCRLYGLYTSSARSTTTEVPSSAPRGTWFQGFPAS
jgi:hypothetical protein